MIDSQESGYFNVASDILNFIWRHFLCPASSNCWIQYVGLLIQVRQSVIEQLDVISGFKTVYCIHIWLSTQKRHSPRLAPSILQTELVYWSTCTLFTCLLSVYRYIGLSWVYPVTIIRDTVKKLTAFIDWWHGLNRKWFQLDVLWWQVWCL